MPRRLALSVGKLGLPTAWLRALLCGGRAEKGEREESARNVGEMTTVYETPDRGRLARGPLLDGVEVGGRGGGFVGAQT